MSLDIKSNVGAYHTKVVVESDSLSELEKYLDNYSQRYHPCGYGTLGYVTTCGQLHTLIINRSNSCD